MTPYAAKLARTDISPPRGDEGISSGVASPSSSVSPSSLPSVAIASVAIHAIVALALVALPMPTCLAPTAEMTWIDIDVAAPTPAAAPEIVPEDVPAPPPPPEVVHRERPRPIVAPEPEIAPPQPEPLAPPSVDDVFGEPPPPAEMMTGTGPSSFAVAPGEAGGIPGGVVGAHGTSLVSAVRPSSESGPSEADRRRARRAYVHSIEQLVGAHVAYPRAALRSGTQGRVELGLRIGADGHVIAIRVATSSGSSLLDDAARDAARGIDRFPTPPAVASLGPSDEVRVGVVYVVR